MQFEEHAVPRGARAQLCHVVKHGVRLNPRLDRSFRVCFHAPEDLSGAEAHSIRILAMQTGKRDPALICDLHQDSIV
jgi:hypothetical protein